MSLDQYLPGKPRLFAMGADGAPRKVQWQSAFSDHRLDLCDLYERALSIEAASYLPIVFHKNDDGRFVAALYRQVDADGRPETLLYVLFDLSAEQKGSLEDFASFVRQFYAAIKSVRVRSFHRISKVRIWSAFLSSTGWEYLNPCEREVLEQICSS